MRQLGVLGITIVVGLGPAGCGPAPVTLAGGKPVAHWLGELKAQDARVRKQAVMKLGNAGTADPAVLPALLGALRDQDAAVRYEVIVALAKNGPATPDALAALSEAQKQDRAVEVRTAARRALEKLRGAE
jgi:HEAT repeat protein